MSQNQMESQGKKRKRSQVVESEEEEEDFFEISKYNIKDLTALIEMIDDYVEKPLPPRRRRKNIPDLMGNLPGIFR